MPAGNGIFAAAPSVPARVPPRPLSDAVPGLLPGDVLFKALRALASDWIGRPHSSA
ncbi:hypothetical protein M3194_20965 [Paenibacillus glycanilyticus]|uniref:hypothetical protein n=1 Tax=Paenibacillus glycanilyticus TaxID=126569 RepID=UPI00203B8D0B|nr:hypothetical protein [Paenibacillus glycanilyticus]MCM3629809.1 hypothetical protein [Paenibacillus glycanilyticus]